MTSARSVGFTLTELLVVIAILGLIVSVAAGVSPRVFERAAFSRARAQLVADLVGAASEARRTGQFGEFRVQPNGAGYVVMVGPRAIERQLSPGLSLSLAPNPLLLNAAGRFEPGELQLQGGRDEAFYRIDPFFGRLHGPGDRPAGSHRGGRVVGAVLRAVSSAANRCGGPTSARARAGIDDCHRAIAACPKRCSRPVERKESNGLVAQTLQARNSQPNGKAGAAPLRTHSSGTPTAIGEF